MGGKGGGDAQSAWYQAYMMQQAQAQQAAANAWTPGPAPQVPGASTDKSQQNTSTGSNANTASTGDTSATPAAANQSTGTASTTGDTAASSVLAPPAYWNSGGGDMTPASGRKGASATTTQT
jgi:hypothetical protein